MSLRKVCLVVALALASPLAAGACEMAGRKDFSKGIDKGVDGLRLHRPVPGTVIAGFGVQKHPLLRIDRFHTGLDLAAASGDAVGAAAPGRVVLAEHGGEYGNLVKIDHGDGLLTA